MEDGEQRSWTDLPLELTSLILLRLGAVDKLENAQKVCRSWRRVCKDPSMWRKIDMANLEDSKLDLESMCVNAVDRSQGGLLEIDIRYFGNPKLLSYIAERSSNLRSLRLAKFYCIKEGFAETFAELPLLEELELSYCKLLQGCLKAVGESCPNLKTLILNSSCGTPSFAPNDEKALAIAETMPGLRHLQLVGNRLSNTGLNAILDSCPYLEHLDLRHCSNVNLVGDLEKRCYERINLVLGPNDSTDADGYPYDKELYLGTHFFTFVRCTKF